MLVSDGILSGDKSDLLRIINKNIYKERNQSADYLIGHAYFINDKHVKEILNNKVIPLLMEYFSGKKETVSKIFTDTNWKVAYNATTYIWDVEPK